MTVTVERAAASCYPAAVIDREISRFSSLADSDQADDLYYRSLTPQQRLDVLLELIQRYQEGLGEAAEGFARVCRVTELAAG